MKYIKIVNEVFLYNIYWFIGNENEFIDFMESKGIEISGNIWDGYSNVLSDGNGYIYLRDKSDYILIHELVHIIQGLLKMKGIDASYSNTEVVAYNIEWAYKKLLYKYYKNKGNDKYKDYK